VTDAELEQSCAEHQGLRDRITELEHALTPFANFADSIDPMNWDEAKVCFHYGKVLTVGHFRRAAKALKERP
jgi:hypothetical protein